MYQIVRITDKEGVAKASPEDRENLGCIGEAKMDEGCVLIHCRYDRPGRPLRPIYPNQPGPVLEEG